jgi:DoxX-like family
MPSPLTALIVLLLLGAVVAAAIARRLERIDAARLARAYLIGVTALMGVRIAAWVAARVFGITAVTVLSTGPHDLTNLLIGALYGVAAVHLWRGGFAAHLRAADVQTSFRVATGVAFVLAGLGGLLFMHTSGFDYFVAVGYSKEFHLFIIAAEVLGGALLLLPWRWLTLAVAAGLTIDMVGALYTKTRTGEGLDPPALVMLLRLLPLALLTAAGRWRLVAVGALACAATAIVGSELLR